MVKPKKGTTLVELCVVMALIAIVGTLIVSFSVVTSQTAHKQLRKVVNLDDKAILDLYIENWIAVFDSAEYTFGIEESNGSYILCAKSKDFTKYCLYIKDGRTLEGTLPGDTSLTYTLENPVTMSCEKIKKTDTTPNITEGLLRSASGRTLFIFQITLNSDSPEDAVSYTLVKSSLANIHQESTTQQEVNS